MKENKFDILFMSMHISLQIIIINIKKRKTKEQK